MDFVLIEQVLNNLILNAILYTPKYCIVTIRALCKDDKADPDKLRLAISKVGHDADDVAADPGAYEKLPACCKKDTEQHE